MPSLVSCLLCSAYFSASFLFYVHQYFFFYIIQMYHMSMYLLDIQIVARFWLILVFCCCVACYPKPNSFKNGHIHYLTDSWIKSLGTAQQGSLQGYNEGVCQDQIHILKSRLGKDYLPNSAVFLADYISLWLQKAWSLAPWKAEMESNTFCIVCCQDEILHTIV